MSRGTWSLVAALLASGVLMACGGDEDGSSERPVETDGGGLPTIVPGPARHEAGREVLSASGCLGCHRIGAHGNAGPGPDLSRVGSRLTEAEIARGLVNPRAPMPSYSRLRQNDPRGFRELVRYLASLR